MTPLSPRRLFLLSALALSALPACSLRPKLNPVLSGETVLALGDSITFGVGASTQTSYPARLAALTGWNVINGGVSGDQSHHALRRLPALLDAHKPKLTLLSIGGNDFLRGVDENTVKDNVAQLVSLCRTAASEVALVSVPKPSLMAAFGSLSDHPLYAALARSEGVVLIEHAWSRVLSSPTHRADPIHPNAAGYEWFTSLLLKELKRSGAWG